MLISIVVPTYNRVECLGRALKSLACQQTHGLFEYEVVVIDNGSNDGTREFLAGWNEPIRWGVEEQSGEAWARNRGLELALGDWVAFFDDDQQADPEWLFQLWKAAQSHSVEIVAGRVELELDPRQLGQMGPDCRQLLGEFGGEQAGRMQGNFYPACCNVLVSRRVCLTLGGFDRQLTVASDTEFFVRAKRAGFEAVYTPKARVWQAVPPQRLNSEFLKRRALWQGSYFVLLVGGEKLGPCLRLALPRVLWALLWHLPLSRVRPRSWRAIGHQARLWSAWGQLRGLLKCLGFPQTRYFAQLKGQAREGRRNHPSA